MSRATRQQRRQQRVAAVRRKVWKFRTLGLLLVVGVGAVAVISLLRRAPTKPSRFDAARPPDKPVATTPRVLPTPAEARSADHIAYRNLLCAQSLPGAEDMDVPALLHRLDEWAERVRSETERHLYRYQRNPGAFDNSEAYFRMLMMAVVLAEDFKVRYNPALIGDAAVGDQFFADSRNVFLHGLLGERRLGTCSSMPVLYVALGRRLGYPVFLAATKGHLFVRWESATEQLNLEATGRGMNHYDDEHYRRWPFVLTAKETSENGYLKSMTPEEESAAFLSIRAVCLRAGGFAEEARKTFAQAAALAPGCKTYRVQAGIIQGDTARDAGPYTPALQSGPAIPFSVPGMSVTPPPNPNPLKGLSP